MGKYNKEVSEKLQELIGNIYALNRKTFTVFADYSGHINAFNLRVIYGGWERGVERPEIGFDAYLNSHNFKHHIRPQPLKCVQLLNEFLLFAEKKWREDGVAILSNNLPEKYHPLDRTS